MKKPIGFLILLIFILSTSTSFAAEVTIPAGDAAGFQMALTNAQNNGEPDTIILEAGTYNTSDNGNNPFTYSAMEDQPLTIRGAGKDMTILNGGGDAMNPGDSILSLVTAGAPSDSNGQLEVRDLSLNNGAGAAVLITSEANITVENLGFDLNFSSLVVNSLSGILNFNDNMFTRENSITATISTDSGTVHFQRNQYLTSNPEENPTFGGFFSSNTGPINVRDNMASGLLFSSLFNINTTSGPVDFVGNTFTDLEIQGLGVTLSVDSGDIDFSENNFTRVGSAGLFNIINVTGEIYLNANGVFSCNSISVQGAVDTTQGPVVATNNIFADNASLTNGQLFINSGEAPVNLVNNTVTDNFCPNSTAGVLIALDLDTASTNIFNNILFGNVSSFFVNGVDLFVEDDDDGNSTGAPVLLSHNDIGDFFSACEDDGACTSDVTRTANISEDPLFMDPGNLNLNLAAGSPAIGTGDAAAPNLPATDYVGHPLNDPPDMGALAGISMLGLNPTSIDFGQVSTEVPATRTVTLSNTGGVPLNVLSMDLDNTTDFALNFNGAAGTCGSATPTINAGESCTIQVIFGPGDEGTFTATLTITTDELDNPTLTVTLSGQGVKTGGGGGCSLGAASGSTPHLVLLGLLFLFWIRRFKK